MWEVEKISLVQTTFCRSQWLIGSNIWIWTVSIVGSLDSIASRGCPDETYTLYAWSMSIQCRLLSVDIATLTDCSVLAVIKRSMNWRNFIYSRWIFVCMMYCIEHSICHRAAEPQTAAEDCMLANTLSKRYCLRGDEVYSCWRPKKTRILIDSLIPCNADRKLRSNVQIVCRAEISTTQRNVLGIMPRLHLWYTCSPDTSCIHLYPFPCRRLHVSCIGDEIVVTATCIHSCPLLSG